ncbi:lytic murein transglycosylase [Streptomyces yaizuensis]|uniref:Lytic transglycosylase domain-containing protein n=1 Tax=Streptomyces yaizuensis TaxID=2989713 RepID=A0ABQ5P7V4_9ACTN|nr:lytic murein transglycosylase [Streptomyces sp. YSPA8]GLF98555.1 lytic transglycosylase domain-containing protein [Streptomyces sp. YSPA8]
MAAELGRRLRRGATTTAVAAAAVAALSASQAPGITHANLGGGSEGPGQGNSEPDAGPDQPATGNSPYYTDLPPLTTPDKPGASIGLPSAKEQQAAAQAGIPATILAAYKNAERTISASDPGCHVPWQLLAAIGKVESGQARGGRVDGNGTTLSPIRGPVLNGVGFANIPDTDNGVHDGDTAYDRAVGPMQFIPSTWASWGQDANADGRKDPNNIHDAALAAGRYLCAGERDLRDSADLDRAILSYNQSRTYLRTVLSWFEYYKKGTHSVPDGTGALPGSDAPDSPGTDATGDKPPAKGPAKPGGDQGGPSASPKPKPGGGDKPGRPKPPTTPPVKPPTQPPTKPPVTAPGAIENAGAETITAVAGRDFAGRVTVRVEDAQGKGLARQAVRFEITGTTDSRFPGGRTSAVLTTAADGRVTAPVLRAGETPGEFIIRATVSGTDLAPVKVTAKVTPRVADALVRVGEKPLTAVVGGEFTDFVEVRATHRGAVASGVGVTATLVKSVEDPTENDKGPYFKGAEGTPLRSLDLTTDSRGVLRLPKLFADGTAGTYVLHLTAVGAKPITVELTVTEAPTTAPSESPSAPAGASPSPSAGASSRASATPTG